jgi:hypothetical protein
MYTIKRRGRAGVGKLCFQDVAAIAATFAASIGFCSLVHMLVT